MLDYADASINIGNIYTQIATSEPNKISLMGGELAKIKLETLLGSMYAEVYLAITSSVPYFYVATGDIYLKI
ncbi:MAG: hypothetical protein ACTS73_07660 [Arsenophonus sp. NEOnobi-MAG3]